MATHLHILSPSTRRTLGLLVAGGILFVIGIGGSGALMAPSSDYLTSTPLVRTCWPSLASIHVD